MPFPVFEPPALPSWAQQLANILPLTVLIEFVDVATKLHVYDLAGCIPLWNWPITPKGARILLSGRDATLACCLDDASHGRQALQCIDGHYGNDYPCSAPQTVRFCVASITKSYKVANNCPSMLREGRKRPQHLSLLWTRSMSHEGQPTCGRQFLIPSSARRCLVFAAGWIAWAVLVAMTLLTGLYTAFAYLMTVVFTGIISHWMFNGGVRELHRVNRCKPRLIVAADNWNASIWWAFYGETRLINSLLNRPLTRSPRPFGSRASIWLLRIFIVGQWALALASCTLQDWNALVISSWCLLCVVATEVAYPAVATVADWLKYDCSVEIVEVKATFSSRRAMLGALVYLNPDAECSRWIDPILSPDEARDKWEGALRRCFARGEYREKDMPHNEEFNPWIEESLKMGKRIKEKLAVLQAGTHVGPSCPA